MGVTLTGRHSNNFNAEILCSIDFLWGKRPKNPLSLIPHSNGDPAG
jgi:hypothetical protein